MTAPPPPAGGNDKTTLFGVLGIILAFCCWPVGLVFAILSYMQAKQHGNSPILAYVGFAILVLGLIGGIFSYSTGMFSF